MIRFIWQIYRNDELPNIKVKIEIKIMKFQTNFVANSMTAKQVIFEITKKLFDSHPK
jgi:hypothetical protein